MNRRGFLFFCASTLTIWFLFPMRKIEALFATTRKQYAQKEQFIALLTAIAESIFPADIHFTGARDLGIGPFLAMNLERDWYRDKLPHIAALARYCDEEASSSFNHDFIHLSPQQQNSILNKIGEHFQPASFSDEDENTPDTKHNTSGSAGSESGKNRHITQQIYDGFSAMIELTLEGCFSHPLHGGNRNGDGWRILSSHFKRTWLET